MDLTIASFNLKSDVPAHAKNAWVSRHESIHLCLRELKPDIIGTQELTIRAIGDIKKLLPEYQWVGLGRNGGSRGEFAAIFYHTGTFTCTASDTFWLGKRPTTAGSRSWTAAYPRICTWGIFRHHSSPVSLAVYNTHLDHLSRWARKEGILQILNFIQQMNTGYPTILMGDFNAYPQTRAVKALRDANNRQYHIFAPSVFDLYYDNNRVTRTYHGFKGITQGKPIDYILTSPDIQIREFIIDHNQYGGVYPSDHYPLVMKIKV